MVLRISENRVEEVALQIIAIVWVENSSWQQRWAAITTTLSFLAFQRNLHNVIELFVVDWSRNYKDLDSKDQDKININ